MKIKVKVEVLALNNIISPCNCPLNKKRDCWRSWADLACSHFTPIPLDQLVELDKLTEIECSCPNSIRYIKE